MSKSMVWLIAGLLQMQIASLLSLQGYFGLALLGLFASGTCFLNAYLKKENNNA